jgi:hypothetical protein
MSYEPFLYPMSEKQLGLIRVLQRQLRCPDDLLDRWCEQQFGCALAIIDRRQASILIDQLKSWESLPAELERMRGQLDLFTVSEGGAA